MNTPLDTHPGTTAKAGMASPDRFNPTTRRDLLENSPGLALGAEIADRLDEKDARSTVGWEVRRALLVEERGMVAFETALALGYGYQNAKQFRSAAEAAARVGLAPSGILRSAGRVSIGTVKSFGGSTMVMSILLDSGAYYDPTRETSIDNNPVGSD